MERSIGRANDCSIVILDPQNRVSRKHAVLKSQGSDSYIKDVGSANGTYVNGEKIPTGQYVKLSAFDKVTLSSDYIFEFNLYSKISRGDETMVLGPSNNDQTVIFDKDRITLSDKDKTVMFDPNKTSIHELSQLDRSPYKIIGRGANNHFVVKNSNVSREHCKMRLLTPILLEIEDLGSSNGTFADGVKLVPGKPHKFSSSVKITLSNQYVLNLKEVFSEIQIIEKQVKKTAPHSPSHGTNIRPITDEERSDFLELEGVWNEYNERNLKLNQNLGNNIGMGASAVGMALSFVVPGAAVVSQGIGLLARYLSQKKSNELRSDLSYENMFLETYCCPRCQESFQKKPWITIRDCFKCKLSFK